MFLYCSVSTLKPMVGTVVTGSSTCNRSAAHNQTRVMTELTLVIASQGASSTNSLPRMHPASNALPLD